MEDETSNRSTLPAFAAESVRGGGLSVRGGGLSVRGGSSGWASVGFTTVIESAEHVAIVGGVVDVVIVVRLGSKLKVGQRLCTIPCLAVARAADDGDGGLEGDGLVGWMGLVCNNSGTKRRVVKSLIVL